MPRLNSTEETGPYDSTHSLALAQRVLHTVAAELLVVVDEGEGQVDVEWVGAVRGCSSLSGLECYHQVYPRSWSLYLKLINKVLTKDLAEQLLKFIVDTD